MLGNIFNYPNTAVSSVEDAGWWSLTIQTQIGPHDCGNAAPWQPLSTHIYAYLLLSSPLSSVLWVFILQYCLGLIVEDIIVRKIEMQALTFCGNDNETRLIVLKP